MPYFIKKIMGLLTGSVLLSIGINTFLIPYELLDGGVIGIGLIVSYIWDVKVGLTLILCSLPIFILAWFKDRTFFYNSFHGFLISSFMIDLLNPVLVLISERITIAPLTSAIIGGIFVGLGIGLMLKFETSTGGTDLLAQIVADTLRINVGISIFIIDFIVIAIGGLMKQRDGSLASLVSLNEGSTRRKKLICCDS
jgi:uncharacterized membrane-anchored protein YitT (DUF2179 family)